MSNFVFPAMLLAFQKNCRNIEHCHIAQIVPETEQREITR